MQVMWDELGRELQRVTGVMAWLNVLDRKLILQMGQGNRQQLDFVQLLPSKATLDWLKGLKDNQLRPHGERVNANEFRDVFGCSDCAHGRERGSVRIAGSFYYRLGNYNSGINNLLMMLVSLAAQADPLEKVWLAEKDNASAGAYADWLDEQEAPELAAICRAALTAHLPKVTVEKGSNGLRVNIKWDGKSLPFLLKNREELVILRDSFNDYLATHPEDEEEEAPEDEDAA